MNDRNGFDWRTIGALNAVSTLSQAGQFGIAYVVIPVWLAEQGLDAHQLGVFASSLWLGQLPGLAVAPWLCHRIGPRWVVAAGLLCTLIALPWIALTHWPFWPLGGALAGLGLGLRWIGVEPWLYRIAPAHARGRLVGFHESLIALAPIAGPVLAGYFGLRGFAVFWIGATFTALAAVPLAVARGAGVVAAPPPGDAPTTSGTATATVTAPRGELVFRQGVVIALLGGMMEAAVSGLFALFAQGKGLSVLQTADLLAVFGVGGLLLQYPVGWLADHRGVGVAAIACALGTAVAAFALTRPLDTAAVMASVFLLGGFMTAFLTLAIIASTMTVAGSMARNVSTISMLYTGTAVVGPLIAGAVMKATRADALMGFTAAAALLMAGALAVMAFRSSRRAAADGAR
jgi:MFS family permease